MIIAGDAFLTFGGSINGPADDESVSHLIAGRNKLHHTNHSRSIAIWCNESINAIAFCICNAITAGRLAGLMPGAWKFGKKIRIQL